MFPNAKFIYLMRCLLYTSLVQNSVPVFGVIYVPVKKELYFGIEGVGAVSYTHLDGYKRQVENLMDGDGSGRVKR